MFGIASGMMRTFANLGMVFSFSVAILVASRSISRETRLRDLRRAPRRCTGGRRPRSPPDCTRRSTRSLGFMVLAAILSALRGSP